MWQVLGLWRGKGLSLFCWEVPLGAALCQQV